MSTQTMTLEEYKSMKKGKSKYGNNKTEYKGRIFDSKREAEYAKHLEYLKHASDIAERVVRVEYQVPYKIYIKSRYICTYLADFRVTYGNKRQEVIDAKGYKTDVYRLKKLMVEAYYGIKIIEV